MKKSFIKIAVYAAVIVVFITVAFSLFRYVGNKAKSSASSGVFSSETVALFKKAKILEKQGELIAAKQTYQKLFSDYPTAENLQKIQHKILSLNIKILFSPTVTSRSKLYEVAPGDSLEKIAKKFNTTIELIKKANNLSGNLIKPGMELKVQKESFPIVVDKSQNTLTLFSGEEIIKVYTVSTGKSNSTPVGTFKIVNKLINPPWHSAKGVIPPDSPENVLGTRWLGIDKAGYGIHGTDKPDSIGYQSTEGCIRMYNADVEELYTIVPRGTKVVIID